MVIRGAPLDGRKKPTTSITQMHLQEGQQERSRNLWGDQFHLNPWKEEVNNPGNHSQAYEDQERDLE